MKLNRRAAISALFVPALAGQHTDTFQSDRMLYRNNIGVQFLTPENIGRGLTPIFHCLKDTQATDVIIDVFYRRKRKLDESSKETSLLLSVRVTAPMVYNTLVASDELPPHIHIEDIRMVRVKLLLLEDMVEFKKEPLL